MALIIGSGQRLHELDGAALQAAGVTLHRRASGGTAVLFAPGMLMQDVALPVGHPLYRSDVTASYAWLGAVWLEALTHVGLTDLSLVSVAAARSDGQQADPLVRRACFGGRSPYEVLAGGRKLVGFAQVRRRAGALFQVGLYATWPGAQLVDLLALSQEERVATVDALATRVVGLHELTPTPPPHAALMDAFAAALAQRHGVVLEATPWMPSEEVATQAALDRFAATKPG
ncbi:MAG: ligase [Candidatus Viridilinea halotolerans]|uniref:Ligase n=1 Tax=Candidatus Viridilinea halotolerans TaxID=2491704 RepID=A0A426TT00_9CHLR|nr:MAG: ligase [Candidatus Viridilinea halotolerans]